MNLSKELFSAYVKNFEFKELFIDMGWNNDRVKQPVAVGSAIFVLESVAEKEGFKILHCSPVATDCIPEYSLRKKIEHQITKLFHEHLIIYTDAAKTEQVWQLAVRESGKPLKVTETSFRINQSPEKLYQRAGGLFITIDEEEKFTIVDVKSRVAQNFQQNSEKVTKKFYDGFKKQHTVFLDFIKGIQAQGDREWYASLMLNRLMFCYFIQKKGFLDKNKKYLQDKLKACQSSQGHFYSFYRSFLLVLFHQGLGAPNHNTELVVEIGQVPYLNGGLFDEHEIEKLNKDINVDDKAFESLFKFFDEWDWHLDTRVNASGKEINPDVIGYIFEKYINDRAEMGAYYTKEDITDYISKNCIIPFLFDETKRAYPSAFSTNSLVWQVVKESGDAYIYEAVKHGVPRPNEQGNTPKLFDDLPDNIQMGFVPELEQKVVDGSGPYLCDLRKQWNTPAPPSIALPTEIYREVIERRKRCADLRKKIASGEITAINDFITYNLNIRQFAQDLLENIDDPDFIRHFYKALCKITILDPTCGSGAFLFAALNILEPLYEACLMRMRAYVEDEGRNNVVEKKRYNFFSDTLDTVQSERHPNQAYFIYKSIILNNLYGVDIMNEAVEIAKLRLFLKLVATVDVDYRKPNLGLEPLPDVDFNIRAGNTLIGYANEMQLKEAFSWSLDFDNNKGKIEEQCDIAARTFLRYKEIQLQGSQNIEDFKVAKDVLKVRLKQLRSELDMLMHKQHYTKIKYSDWLNRYKPFHWLAEYYEIIHYHGGFDVIIGNPPYVVYNESSFDYKISDYKTKECGDLYSYVIERATAIANKDVSIGMIVPISIVSTDAFEPLRNILRTKGRKVFFSCYSMRPGKLFDGVEKHLTILLSVKGKDCGVFSSKYHRWYSDSRSVLFSDIRYVKNADSLLSNNSIPKIGTKLESFVLTNIMTNVPISFYTSKYSSFVIYHTRKLRYFLQFLVRPPEIYENDGALRVTSELKKIYLKSEEDQYAALSVYLSSLFFWYYITYSDCRNLNKREVFSFPFSLLDVSPELISKLVLTGSELMTNLQEKSTFQDTVYKKYGHLKMQVFKPRLSKSIVDRIDMILAQHYQLNHEQLDFIINFDIKYRMGLTSEVLLDEDDV